MGCDWAMNCKTHLQSWQLHVTCSHVMERVNHTERQYSHMFLVLKIIMSFVSRLLLGQHGHTYEYQSRVFKSTKHVLK